MNCLFCHPLDVAGGFLFSPLYSSQGFFLFPVCESAWLYHTKITKPPTAPSHVHELCPLPCFSFPPPFPEFLCQVWPHFPGSLRTMDHFAALSVFFGHGFPSFPACLWPEVQDLLFFAQYLGFGAPPPWPCFTLDCRTSSLPLSLLTAAQKLCLAFPCTPSGTFQS